VTDETWARASASRPVRPVATRARNLPGPRRRWWAVEGYRLSAVDRFATTFFATVVFATAAALTGAFFAGAAFLATTAAAPAFFAGTVSAAGFTGAEREFRSAFRRTPGVKPIPFDALTLTGAPVWGLRPRRHLPPVSGAKL